MTIFAALRKGLAVAAAIAALTVGNVKVHADTIFPDLASVDANGDGTFTWNYNVFLSGGSALDTSKGRQYMVIYDFEGYVPGTISFAEVVGDPNDWSFSDEAFSTVPDNLTVSDTSVPNLVLDYTGDTRIGTTGSPPQSILLGVLSAFSTIGQTKVGDFTSQDVLQATNSLQQTIGPVLVPVPEPASLAMVGLGLIGIPGLMFVQRRRRAANA